MNKQSQHHEQLPVSFIPVYPVWDTSKLIHLNGYRLEMCAETETRIMLKWLWVKTLGPEVRKDSCLMMFIY